MCSPSAVASLSLSPTKLIVGTYEGLIHIFGMQQLLHGSTNALDMKISEVLRAHHKSVYSVTWLRGDIGVNGYTSFCPTFVGQTEETVSREFLVCIGYGRHSLVDGKIPSVFRSFTQQRGVCLHGWIIWCIFTCGFYNFDAQVVCLLSWGTWWFFLHSISCTSILCDPH